MRLRDLAMSRVGYGYRRLHVLIEREGWHVEDKGVRHVYIKPRSPQLNGKVEGSHRTDREEFFQLLTYTDDVDLD
jgi:transposase InsO family protein